jgi:hypothetical protein
MIPIANVTADQSRLTHDLGGNASGTVNNDISQLQNDLQQLNQDLIDMTNDATRTFYDAFQSAARLGQQLGSATAAVRADLRTLDYGPAAGRVPLPGGARMRCSRGRGANSARAGPSGC